MKRNKVVFTGKGQVELHQDPIPSPGEGEVLIKTELSLMSTGTENICFNRLFAEGTHWDRWVKYPFDPGYCCVGIVEEVGSGVTNLSKGTRVVYKRPHASHIVISASQAYPVPPEVLPEEAVWFPLGQITYNGARNVGFKLGDKVAVVGAGPIGQMTLRWAVACGAEEAVSIDTVGARLELAKVGGATHVIEGQVADAKEPLKKRLGQLPDVVADATGHHSVFQPALGLVRDQGRFLLIGDTGSPAEQRLTIDVVPRGLTLQGAHMNNTYLDRSEAGIAHLFFRLVGSKRFNLDKLNTHFFSPEQAKDAYRLANERRGDTMGILFRW